MAALKKGDFSTAEELISRLSISTIDQEEQLAILYQCEEKYEDAQKIWEGHILKCVVDLQTALANRLEWSLLENRDEEAECFAAADE